MSDIPDHSSSQGVDLSEVKKPGVWPWGSLVAGEIAGDAVRAKGINPEKDPIAYNEAVEQFLDKVYLESLGRSPERK